METRRIQVIDGDSFQYEGRVYQIAFVDAPEIGQACLVNKRMWHCGLDAAYNLRKIFELESEPVSCSLVGRENDLVVDCVTGSVDLSEHLLLEGYVVATANAPRDYQLAENRARQVQMGLWRSQFVPPEKWRKGERLPQEHPHDPNAPLLTELPWHYNNGKLYYDPEERHLSCIVKGKLMPDGRHVYYSPLDAEYRSVALSLDRGDKVFCGDEDARIHGFRHVGERDGIALETGSDFKTNVGESRR